MDEKEEDVPEKERDSTVSYAIGILAGLLLGGIVGQLKNLFIWKRYLAEDAAQQGQPNQAGSLYGRAFVSYSVNILTLVAAFLIMDILPFSGGTFLIGTAVSLSVMNKLLALGQKKRENDRKESG